MKRIALALCIALAAAQATAAPPLADPSAITVATFAGSGAMGIADGDAADASFQFRTVSQPRATARCTSPTPLRSASARSSGGT